MPSLITFNFSNSLAKTFLDSLASPNPTNILYFFMGKQNPWDGNGDTNPPTPLTSINSYKQVWDNMIAAELVTLSNMSLVIPNVTWVSNTNYLAYTDTNPYLFTSNTSVYVITSNNEVYKCLSNNNGGLSTVQPVGLGSTSNNYIQSLSDGYVWKYMLNIQPNDQFLNYFYIPIPEIAPVNSNQYIIQQAATPGSIDFIQVNNGGVNYINSSNSYIVQITGDGSGANAYANVSSGMIQNIVMADSGMNYTYANVVFTDANGSGAMATAIMSPPGGNGSQTDVELGANSIMVSIATSGNVSGYFSTSTQFRQVGLILNPIKYNSNTVLTQALVNTCTTLVVTSGIGNYIAGETVYQGPGISSATFTGVVIDYNTVSNVLRVNAITGSPSVSQLLLGLSSGSEKYLINYTNPDVQPYTGVICAINNEIPLVRAPTQTESFKIVLPF